MGVTTGKRWNTQEYQDGGESRKVGKDQEKIQSSTTPDPGYHMGM